MKNGTNKLRLPIPVVFQMNRKRTCVQPLAKKRISGRNKRKSLICKAWKVLINESEKNNHLLVLIELQCIGGEHVSDRLPKDWGCKPMHPAAALQSLNESALERKSPKKAFLWRWGGEHLNVFGLGLDALWSSRDNMIAGWNMVFPKFPNFSSDDTPDRALWDPINV